MSIALLILGSGDNSQGALQALLSRISLESNPSPIIALDTARSSSLIRGPKLSTGTQSDMESIWRSEIASPSSSISFRLQRDIQPIYSVTESGNMILEGSNLNQAIEVSCRCKQSYQIENASVHDLSIVCQCDLAKEAIMIMT